MTCIFAASKIQMAMLNLRLFFHHLTFFRHVAPCFDLHEKLLLRFCLPVFVLQHIVRPKEKRTFLRPYECTEKLRPVAPSI